MAYTVEQTAVIEKFVDENGRVTFEQAEALATELGKTPRSVISKVKQLGLAYVPKEKKEPAEPRITKADLVAQIAANIGIEAELLVGLRKATAKALGELVNAT